MYYHEDSMILSPKQVETPVEISSLLPSDFVEEIEITPNDVIQSEKIILNQPYRNIKRIPRTKTLIDPQPMVEQPSPHEITKEPTSSLNCFEVKLANCTVLAFSIYEHQENFGCGVVVRDGACLRYGRILKPIPPEESRVSAYQIIEFDKNNLLGEYVTQQTEISKALINTFMKSKKTAAELKEIEIVSYGSRATLRICITNSNEAFNEALARFVISAFAIAVEIIE
ncbi:hypothetical protein TRFO_19071 [Tritrichomonas foetus]|uniref:Uncharacterized protein n=1 Tax=Tritrichomonas foetus TaxID=1144522 RepID=A0A1J4KKI1_9EUKA|nr:hypothetical protein TRFO_19071 [Tritrichomonas foetus]|eukprot:OHT11440.1 hypothetical protein TRFO_19071 [Tritrichomonas foetus]